MTRTNTVLAFVMLMFLAPFANATKCGEVVYNKHGKLRKYNVLPLGITEGSKKYGSSSSSDITTESSTASTDPGVSTGASDSQTQSTSTKGDCKWGGFFGNADRRDFQNYAEQNMNEIKNQIALGEGGHLEILAAFSGCSQVKVLGRNLQKNMVQFVDLNEQQGSEFVDRVRTVIVNTPQLSQRCGSLALATAR